MSADVIKLLAMREEPLSVDEVVAAVNDAGAGGTAVFIGTVRDNDSGRSVEQLDYSAHPSVDETLRSVAEKVVATHPVLALAAVHRVGTLAVGDIAVVVAAACSHRGDAFTAARMLIDDLKSTVPIWKHQSFSDGSDEWVGLP